MEVSVVGKTMTPLLHHHIEFDASSSMRDACEPLPRRHSEVKLPVKFLVDARKEQLLCSPIYDRSKLNITPILRNMTLAETYNFARAQLNSQPLLELRHCKTRTPTLNFNRVNLNGNAAAEKMNGSKEFEVSTSTTPLISCKTSQVKDSEVTTTEKPENIMNPGFAETHSRSSPVSRKQRKKSSKKRKRHRQIAPQTYHVKRSGNIPPRLNLAKLHTEISLSSKLLPPKTQQSPFITFKSAFEKHGRKDELILPSPTKSTLGSNFDNSTKRGNLNQPLLTLGNSLSDSTKRRNINQPLSRNVELKSIRNNDLLSSLDSSLNKKEKLSMRIQLIHRYGNEDVISKHRELSRKREVADKLQKKSLELQANARIKEQQRAKIYALNQLMTKLEQEQFEAHNKQKSI